MHAVLKKAEEVVKRDQVWDGWMWRNVFFIDRYLYNVKLSDGGSWIANYNQGNLVMVRAECDSTVNTIVGNTTGTVIQGKNFGTINV